MTLCPALLRKLKQIEVLDTHDPIRLPISTCRHILFLPPVTKHKLSPCSHISQAIYVPEEIPSPLTCLRTLRSSPLSHNISFSLCTGQFQSAYKHLIVSSI